MGTYSTAQYVANCTFKEKVATKTIHNDASSAPVGLLSLVQNPGCHFEKYQLAVELAEDTLEEDKTTQRTVSTAAFGANESSRRKVASLYNPIDMILRIVRGRHVLYVITKT